MKARSLVSCILLSTLVILLLSTVTQATEYRRSDTEVNADEILNQINQSNDIYLNNCNIVGDLYVSKMKLETISSPLFNINDGSFHGNEVDEILNVIESNITITNSNFENSINFSNTIFKKSISFQNTSLNYAMFNGAVFSNSADFYEAKFNSYTDFSRANFRNHATFHSANFRNNSFFHFANFSGLAEFSMAQFDNSADFSSANFHGGVSFDQAGFNSDSSFEYVNFNNSTDFSFTLFNMTAIFIEANFRDSARFFHTSFNSNAYFDKATFSKEANFDYANFNYNADFEGPSGSAYIITNDAKTCEFFRNYYKGTARYEDSDNMYYNYRKECQTAKDWTDSSKWMDILSWITCGYGLRPSRALYFGGLVIVLFSIIYSKGQGICRLSNATEQNPIVSFWDALYFSIATFTTVGSGDWYPRDKFRKWVTLEGMLGWIMLGIFMATLTNVMIRS